MIPEDLLVQEFISVVNLFYPKVGEFLKDCYVTIITTYWGRPPRKLQYIGIYGSNKIIASVKAQKDALREVAQHMGLAEVVCLNATPLVRDPMSNLKQNNPRFWLELYWIAAQQK
jgi:hypothetical protein